MNKLDEDGFKFASYALKYTISKLLDDKDEKSEEYNYILNVIKTLNSDQLLLIHALLFNCEDNVYISYFIKSL